MTEQPNQCHRAASPYSTGGGGTRFEHRFGAMLLVRLLTAQPIRELGERAPVRVAFQQSPKTSVDDIVVTSSNVSGVSIQLEIAVRRSPVFVVSNEPTKKLVSALVQADIDAERNPNPLVQRRFALAVSGQQTHTQEVAELAEVARGQSTAEGFIELVRTPGKFATRKRLNHLIKIISDALENTPDGEVGTPEYRCWSLLQRLWIMQVNLEAGHEEDWTRLISDLKPVAVNAENEGTSALRDVIEQLSANLDQNAGSIDAALLRRRLHGHIRPDAHVPPLGWSHLVALDKQTRDSVARSIFEDEPTPFKLPRHKIREELKKAIDAEGNLLVKGDSGVGKSALVMDAIDQMQLGANHQAIAINLRYLPTTQIELRTYFSTPIEQLFLELTAPHRLLVIDSAEAIVEDHSEVFTYLLKCAKDNGMKVISITITEAAGTVKQLMRSEPDEFAIPGLDNDELTTAASHMAALQRLVENPRARELLRRPIVIKLFSLIEDHGMPLNEAQALEHIWKHLVRNNERNNLGAPDAREQAMLRIAAHTLQKGDIDDLLARLDHAAIDGLRRSGLLQPANSLPWKRVPEYKHDLLRAYSVARLLLEERNPAASLTMLGAPRWTLPSARLACEILLSAPEEPSHPRIGRFEQLQIEFDTIADAVNNKRWSDVPTEALLTVPNNGELLRDAWPTLINNNAHGLTRLIRVLHRRHQGALITDPIISGPIITQLLDVGTPAVRTDRVDKLIRNWLRAHVLQGTSAGQPERIALRKIILERCAEKEQVLDEEEATRQAKLAARTPEEIAAGDKRHRELAPVSRQSMFRKQSKAEHTRHRPLLWINNTQIEHLALLGPDLGPGGEAILRRIAEDEPHSLDFAVEPPFAGNSLAAYDPKLLIDLSAAYYIKQRDIDSEWTALFRDDGIRSHRFGGVGVPLVSIVRGPFLPLFRADFRGGVALLNRMLGNAALCRVRTLSSFRDDESPDEDRSEMKLTLSITGEPREYIGDGHVWLWYRGTGVGPYPCMSALQALEFVAEEHIHAGVSPQTLTSIMLKEANNLAMPALALGILVRHLEVAGEAIDPYLVDPIVWHLEFSRVSAELAGSFISQSYEIPNSDRRKWSLNNVSMMLALSADAQRIEQLKALGEQLLENATEAVGGDSSTEVLEYLANVKNWAASLDRAAYEVRQEDNNLLVQQIIDPEIEQILEKNNDDLIRTGKSHELTSRHVYARENNGDAIDIEVESLAADIALARQLLDSPPQSVSFSADGPVAVAASAVELHLTNRTVVTDNDLIWSAITLLQVAVDADEHPNNLFPNSHFSQGADRSAARALPFLLLPEADDLRTSIDIHSADDMDEFIELNRAVAVRGDNEVRLLYARSLDAIWKAPCDKVHLYDQCHHGVAFDLVTESFLESVLGLWDNELQRRPIVKLDPPEAKSLDNLSGKEIYVQRLTPALRAMSAAAISSACCKDNALATLQALLKAHQSAMLAHKHGYHDSQNDSLVVARAALLQAVDGRDEIVIDYIRRYLGNADLLAEGLQALSTAADERQELGQHARQLWPNIMDLVLDTAAGNPNFFAQQRSENYAMSALIPNPSDEWWYLTSEKSTQPYLWRNLIDWAPQVERWLEAKYHSNTTIDQLVVAVRELDIPDQIEQGLRWIEQIVIASKNNCASTYTLPEWLRERQTDLVTGDQIARWLRIVDMLVVAGDSRVADLAD